MGIEPKTSWLDLPLLRRLSYEVGQEEVGDGLGGESRRRESKGTYECTLSASRGFDSHRGQNNFFFTSCGSLTPFARANAQWVFHGLHIAL